MTKSLDSIPMQTEKLCSKKSYSFPSIEKNGSCNIQSGMSLMDFPETISDPEYILRREDYGIRLANSPRLRSEASALIQRMYSWRGYDTKNATVYSHNNNWMTFEASSKQQLFGTLTLDIDGEDGLLADDLYEKEINIFRTKNRKVCEVSKFAVDSEYGSKEVFASLFHLAYIYARSIHKADDAFIEVNPRHAGFYKRMLGFHPVGEIRTCQRVDAPAVLLHLNLDYMDAQISSRGGSCKTGERSLYPYFFSQDEEEGFVRKLRMAH